MYDDVKTAMCPRCGTVIIITRDKDVAYCKCGEVIIILNDESDNTDNTD